MEPITADIKPQASLPWAAAILAAGALSACGGGTAPPPEMLDLPSARRDTALLRSAPLRAAPSVFDATSLLDWAEITYPQYFPGTQPSLFFAPYVYRYYPETQNYVGVAGNDVYVLGPVFNDVLTWVGTLADFSCTAHPSSCAAGPANATEAARFLAQATLGASRADISNLQAGSYRAWLDAQFALPRGQSHYDWLAAHGYTDEAFRNNSQGLDNTIWRKLIAGNDALRQRVTLALSEICVASVLGVSTAWRQFAVANYLDILEANAFGNYRTLLEQVSLSTAMGYYLTYRGNAKANATTGSQPDENYARELMQLFTIGPLLLNPDGTPSGGETYGQDDVSGLARASPAGTWTRAASPRPCHPKCTPGRWRRWPAATKPAARASWAPAFPRARRPQPACRRHSTHSSPTPTCRRSSVGN